MFSMTISSAFAQVAAVSIVNHTGVDIEVNLYGTDGGYVSGSSLITNVVTVSPSGAAFPSPCAIQLAWGWQYCSFTGYTCPPGPFPWTTVWTDARITIPSANCGGCVADSTYSVNFGTSCSYPYTSGVGDFYPSGSCSSHYSVWTRSTGGTTPDGDDIQIECLLM